MEMLNKRGYLKEDFRLFHIRDQVELELGYHYHEFDKIVVFLTGNVTYVVEGKAYFLKPWDILLVPHNQIHRPIIDPSEPYERIILWTISVITVWVGTTCASASPWRRRRASVSYDLKMPTV